MNVTLPPELEGYTRAKVESGRYTSASEVVREALRLHQERDAKLNHVRALIQEGIESGDPQPYDREAIKTMLLDHAATLRARSETNG